MHASPPPARLSVSAAVAPDAGAVPAPPDTRRLLDAVRACDPARAGRIRDLARRATQAVACYTDLDAPGGTPALPALP